MSSSSSFTSEVLSITTDGPVATLWLDRPEARNAMAPQFFEDLPRAVAEINADATIRAIVVAAKGPHFSVGLDLKAVGASGGFSGGGSSAASRAMRTRTMALAWQAAITTLADSPKPTIAAVHGYCIGGGVDLITACDVRFASDDAIFSVRETKVAIVADLGSLQRLPRLIGHGLVNELALSGKDISAERAKSIGLVNDLGAGPDGAYQLAHGLAVEIAQNSPIVVAGTKAVLKANDGRTIAEGLDYVATWSGGFINSNDLTEAMGAFLEKRPPNFTGS